ncbi:PAS domain S-box-containing protein/diguanylate cyclase (GGDEF) domain-containing protein [Desulfonauticus submarinus]|uniref:PAS domain S-box-containing protein/diguanylate cyclase (GGDEF) domain-containing protein n=1 Tax=Desulfonauticus submarinus TaxID=206665 RepID=A0A1H0FNF1_9BACT|nr:GGDEF domain-containing phosphodiesterase [Desulfonauticus submarinus]SDN96124.1 PAS domain S-box-containing protein/diguanylate cyclase (GGDEF) domain-containing protein [Desulfonauticus submarinus]
MSVLDSNYFLKNKFEDFFEIKKEINNLILSSYDEYSILKSICKILFKQFSLYSVWIGKLSKKQINKLCSIGKDKDYFQKIPEFYIQKENRHILSKLLEGKIIIHNDIRISNLSQDIKKFFISRKIFSNSIIPIISRDNEVYLLELTSLKENFFTLNASKEILEEIKKDIIFAISYLQDKKNYTIIAQALENSLDWVIITNLKGEIIYVNKTVTEVTGYRKEELLGQNPRVLKSGYHDQNFYKQLWETITSGHIFEALFIDKKKDGTIFYSKKKIVPVEIEGKIEYFVAFGKDVTNEQNLKDEVEKNKYIDQLTKVYNFFGFKIKAIQALDDLIKKDDKTISAIIIFDIYDFTTINNIYGTKKGDLILKVIANRLRHHLQEKDIICRVGGDSFATFIYSIPDKKSIISFINNLIKILEEPITIHLEKINLTFNAGASIFPDDATNFAKLYENASLSLSQARKQGEGIYKIFDLNMDILAKKRIKAEKIIKQAIIEETFCFHFQPYFTTTDLKVAGYEALLRIKKNNSIIYPNDFIEVLEEKKYLKYFEEWSLKYFQNLFEKLKKTNMNCRISYNISANSFKNNLFLKKLLKFCKKYGNNFTIEITERVLLEDIEKTIQVLTKFKKHTATLIAIDDFGTGYSSLSYLIHLPIDIVKLDVSFIKNMTQNSKNASLVEAIIYLGKKIGLKTIAEGVENKKQLELLKSFGCDFIQGYLLSKPILLENTKFFSHFVNK